MSDVDETDVLDQTTTESTDDQIETADEPIEEADSENESTDNVKQPKNKLFNTIIIASVIICLVCAGIIGFKLYQKSQRTLPKSHVFVCDNPKNKSDFDYWISDTLEVTWVPSYVVIDKGYVVGAFDGCIPEGDFSNKLALACAYSIPFYELPPYQITNLDGNSTSLKQLFGENGPFVLEIVWIDCEDCQLQDKLYTQEIYDTYTTNAIYRYYIKSDRKKVEETYN